ncbi:MAG: MG2 domain-containing protein [bacterium]|nr:MG2 domain-containing protein [bacterium]
MPTYEALQKLYSEGNYTEAYDGLEQRALSPSLADNERTQALQLAVSSLGSLGRSAEVDELLEKLIASDKVGPLLLTTVADQYAQATHWGEIVGGKYRRGSYGHGKSVVSLERDRVLAIKYYLLALSLAEKAADRNSIVPVISAMSHYFLAQEPWRLAELTDSETIPDYEPTEGGYGGWQSMRSRNTTAPVDEAGQAIFYNLPQSLAEARSDGERLRWVLHQLESIGGSYVVQSRQSYAEFMQSQFGVETLLNSGSGLSPELLSREGSKYALHTLADDETIALLASGIKRFDLPQEHNPIVLYQSLLEESTADRGEIERRLAEIYRNRRQFERAAELFDDCRKHSTAYDWRVKLCQAAYEQIKLPWVEFLPVADGAAGQAQTFEIRHRNTNTVTFTAYQLDAKRLLADVKEYLQANPRKLDWETLDISSLASYVSKGAEKKYRLGKPLIWKEAVTALAAHRDSVSSHNSRVNQAGLYLVQVTAEGGNTAEIITSLNKVVIVAKPIHQGRMYIALDAISGHPLPGIALNFFGYWQKWRENQGTVSRWLGREFDVVTKTFSCRTDREGICQIEQDDKAGSDDQLQNYQWLVTVEDEGELRGWFGFDSLNYGWWQRSQLDQVKFVAITDRPVYRPGDTVKMRLWLRRTSYLDAVEIPQGSFSLQINDGKGEKFLEKSIILDKDGGYSLEVPLAADAVLGNYSLWLYGSANYSSTSSFRVEEYKKPEFEVKVDAGPGVSRLGTPISAVIKANYYHGAPVTKAHVHYKVLRKALDSRIYPSGRWDWLYGYGYLATPYESRWLPGWGIWGCKVYNPIFAADYGPPVIVAEETREIAVDGTLSIAIDTSFVSDVFSDTDHEFEIVAEVTDESRRMITGSGKVVAVRKPFNIALWTDRGFARPGESFFLELQAQDVNSKGVAGDGKVTVSRVVFDSAGEAKETFAGSHDVHLDDTGKGRLQLKAGDAGQYRLSLRLKDFSGEEVEGGMVLSVFGEGADKSENIRFNDLEIVSDRTEYHDGDRARIRVNTALPDANVLFFFRPENGSYKRPELISLKGKSEVVTTDVTRADMPNFFVEGLMVRNGQLFSEVREVRVPPADIALKVELTVAEKKLKPATENRLTVTLRDDNGRPFVGVATVAVYDKSVEYISGGSNVPDLLKTFWEWKRNHSAVTSASNEVGRGQPLWREGGERMQSLGVFGDVLSDEDGFSQKVRGETMAFGRKAMPMSMVANSIAEKSADGLLGGGIAASPSSSESAKNVPSVALRSDFADTAYWQGNLVFDEGGRAEIPVKLPDNLATWKVKVWAFGSKSEVGEGEAEFITTKDLLVRLQTPRFFVEGDEVIVSANIHNYHASGTSVAVKLSVDGDTVSLDSLPDEVMKTVMIAAGGEEQLEWTVRAVKTGAAIFRLSAQSADDSDGVEIKLPVNVHGTLKTDARSVVLAGDEDSASMTVDVPEKRDSRKSRLQVRWSPSIALSLVDALPYLIAYPYGCTEQTLNRFLPAMIVKRILADLGIPLDEVKGPRANLDAQSADKAEDSSPGWKRHETNPVFDEAELSRVVLDGYERLQSMQLSDGGWGWFSGYGEQSTAHTTATVMRGLLLAREYGKAGEKPDENSVNRGLSWLETYQREELAKLERASLKTEPYKSFVDDLDVLVMLTLAEAGKTNVEMMQFAYRDRTHLSVYAQAMLGLVVQGAGLKEETSMILRNLRQRLKFNEENQTAYLEMGNSGYWWHWYGSEVEAHAYLLKFLSRLDGKGKEAAGVAKYLLNNRRHATYWNSTRDTALAIEALAEFVRASGEQFPDMEVELMFDGKSQKSLRIDRNNLFSYDDRFELLGDEVTGGRHTVELRKSGAGRLYSNLYLTTFDKSELIESSGLELKVDRTFYRMHRKDIDKTIRGGRGEVHHAQREGYIRERLESLDDVRSGDMVEVELVLTAANDYEYLVAEDMKAAGLEAVEVKSGYTQNELGAYVEYRDNRVMLFIRSLRRGTHSISYRFRAETPGRFAALPATFSAMYAPELRGNSSSMKVVVKAE